MHSPKPINPAKHTKPSIWLPLFTSKSSGSELQVDLINTWVEDFEQLSPDEQDHLRWIVLMFLRVSENGYDHFLTLQKKDPKRMDHILADFLEKPEYYRTLRSKLNMALAASSNVLSNITWNVTDETDAEWNEINKKGTHFSKVWVNFATWLSMESKMPKKPWTAGFIKLVKAWSKQNVDSMSDDDVMRWKTFGTFIMHRSDVDWPLLFMNAQVNMHHIASLVHSQNKDKEFLQIMERPELPAHIIGQFWKLYEHSDNKLELLQTWGYKYFGKDAGAIYKRLVMLPSKETIHQALTDVQIDPETFIDATIKNNTMMLPGYQAFIVDYPESIKKVTSKAIEHLKIRNIHNTLPQAITSGFTWIQHVSEPQLKTLLRKPMFASDIATYLEAAAVSMRSETWPKNQATCMLLSLLPEDHKSPCVQFLCEKLSIKPSNTTEHMRYIAPWYWLKSICDENHIEYPSFDILQNLAETFNQKFLDVCITTFQQAFNAKTTQFALTLEM